MIERADAGGVLSLGERLSPLLIAVEDDQVLNADASEMAGMDARHASGPDESDRVHGWIMRE